MNVKTRSKCKLFGEEIARKEAILETNVEMRE
jgi:hypothetical protein